MPSASFVEQMSGVRSALVSGLGGIVGSLRPRSDEVQPTPALRSAPSASPFRIERLVGLEDGAPAPLLVLTGWAIDQAGRGGPLAPRDDDGIEPRLARRLHRVVLERAAALAGWTADLAGEDVVICHLPADSLSDEAMMAVIADDEPAARNALIILVPASAEALRALQAMPGSRRDAIGLSVDRPDELDRLSEVLTDAVAAVELGVRAIAALADEPRLGRRVIDRLRKVGTPVLAAGITYPADLQAAAAIGLTAGRGPLLTRPQPFEA